jgi:hypothetical protein
MKFFKTININLFSRKDGRLGKDVALGIVTGRCCSGMMERHSPGTRKIIIRGVFKKLFAKGSVKRVIDFIA